MMPRRTLKWTAGLLLALTLPVAALFAVSDWNWLRGPVEKLVTEKTGRALVLGGDLKVRLGWPLARVHAARLSFANPAWARNSQLLTADELEFAIDLPRLLTKNIVIRDAHLVRPVVFLEQSADGRKNWLLDIDQRDEGASVSIDRLTLDRGRIGYEDPRQLTRIEAEVTTEGGAAPGGGVAFSAHGRFHDLPLDAQGSGGPILALRDESLPYPLKIDAAIGPTRLQAEGSVTGLATLAAIDARLALSGASLAQLFPILGIALPDTRVYRFAGQLQHHARIWRYEKFSGRIGGSDIAGSLQVDGGGKRPFLRAELLSQVLDLADLGPVIGGGDAAPPPEGRVLPAAPFRTERWDSVDADVKLSAASFRRAQAMPLENLVTRLQLRDAVLSLDPLRFGVAGGSLAGTITLDGRRDPLQARAQGQARKILLQKLFPGLDPARIRSGRIDGNFDLSGSGGSVARILGSADGKLAFVMDGGQISRLMVEAIGLHLWEMLQLKLAGDRASNIRCGIADFSVKDGVMTGDALVLDTDIATITATGGIDLGREQLDLLLTQRTKITSPVALRSPIAVRGSFAKPRAAVDTGRVAVRGLGALALGLVNPFAALLPLVEAGPGADSDCAALIRTAQAPPPGKARASPPAAATRP